ncbi:MAG: heparinase II/III family protein, partial [Puniceicoccales bacterium]|nr:heparinase II/III family protein [Puniceicoccales bacterium]
AAAPAQKVTDAAIETALAKAPAAHPRLFATPADFARLRAAYEQAKAAAGDNSARSPSYSALAGAGALRLVHDARNILTTAPVERRFDSANKRILRQSRRALERISTLALAFQLTGDVAFRDRAVAEMRVAAAFRDWNPPHFLDTAEMTLALAIGYDWLHDALAPADRAVIAGAIREKGLRASVRISKNHGWWINATNNWGQVCHGGLLGGAFALHDTGDPADRALAAAIIGRAVRKLPRPMSVYAPAGAYPEGPGYWAYGTMFNAVALALLEGNLGTDFGLCALRGFDRTVEYLDLMTGPSGKTFNYADGGDGRASDCAMWWLAKRFRRPDALLHFELPAYRRHCAERPATEAGGRLFALTLLWLQDLTAAAGKPPRAPLAWKTESGENAIAVLRTGWDAGALFTGIKGGTARTNHGHMDAGSFIFEAAGVRWAVDLGPEPYEKLERLRLSLWDMAQNSDRWRVFRLNNFSHNTLTVAGKLHRVGGFAKFIDFNATGSATAAGAVTSTTATLDLAPVLAGADRATRRFDLNAGGLTITDDLALRAPQPVRWTFATRAAVEIDAAGTGATLRQNGQTLRVEATGALPDGARFRTFPAAPATPTAWDSLNPGVTLVGFETAGTAAELRFVVRFVAPERK